MSMKELENVVLVEFDLEEERDKVRFLQKKRLGNIYEVVFEYEDKKLVAFFRKDGKQYTLAGWWFLT